MSLVCIGCGNTGMLLATRFDEDPILFSTAHQDTVNFKNSGEIYSFSKEGASKRFKSGIKIWEQNSKKLERVLEEIRDDYVVIFSSLGGGSGSSSLSIISKILLENNNKVLIVGILPYKKEVNPPLSNAVLSINGLMPLISKVSIILFDNDKLRKQFDSDWGKINHHIVRVTDYIVFLLDKYTVDKYSPLTLDQSELDSVIFGGGFLDFSETFLEESLPKFEYGSLDKGTKNCLVAMFVDKKIPDEELGKYHNIFTEVSGRIATRASNSRMIPGILRGSMNKTNSKQGIKDRAYITIASGLSIDKYIKKISRLRDVAVKKASAYMEEYKGEKILDSKESKILDI